MGLGGVKALGSLILAILVGFVALWVLLQLFVGALKLIGVLIAIGLAVVAYMLAEKLIGKGR
jgi:multisubunit Na+/H+ antiporter MnhE subunit